MVRTLRWPWKCHACGLARATKHAFTCAASSGRGLQGEGPANDPACGGEAGVGTDTLHQGKGWEWWVYVSHAVGKGNTTANACSAHGYITVSNLISSSFISGLIYSNGVTVSSHALHNTCFS